MRSLRIPGLTLLALGCGALLFSCGGGDGNGSPTPPVETGQTVLVQVTTTGEDIDPDGYTVRLGTRTAAVQPTGTATFDDVSTGTYQVSLEGVAANCQVQGATSTSVTVTASSGAQTSFTIVCVVDFGDGLATVACTGLSLAASSGVPMDRIAAGSVPGTLQPPLAARVMTSDGTVGYAWFRLNDEDDLEFVTPLHPSGELGGGDVLIRATDGNVACEPFEFTIEPLPSSPGELGTVVDLLQDVLRTQAAVLGTTPEELMTTPLGDVPEVLLPMALIQWVLDHPENGASLARIADATAPVDVPLDLVEALLARTGFREGLENRMPSAQGAPSGTSATVDPQACSPEAVGGNTERLSDCMNAVPEVLAELFGFLADASEDVSAASGLLEGLPAGSESAYGVLIGLLWASHQQEVYAAALLPCCFSGSSMMAVPTRFDEDDPAIGTWSAEVTARSEGWDAAVEQIEAALQQADFIPGLQQVQVVSPDVAGEINDLLPEELGDVLPDMEIPPKSFGPVSIDDEQWSAIAYDGTSVDSTTHNQYKAIEAGETDLLVFTRDDADGFVQFGGRQIGAAATLTVDEIEITLAPDEILLEPGEETTFRVTVENALKPDLIHDEPVEGEMLQGVLNGLIFRADGSIEVGYTAPQNPDFDDTDRIQVRSVANTGARAAENAPPRVGMATIRFGSIRIEQTPVCLFAMEEVDFTAKVEGPDDETVTWTATRGTIDSETGHYEAPEDGTATVRATSNAEPDLVDEVTFGIGCVCEYELTLGGETVVAEPGDHMTFGTSGGRLTGVSIQRPSVPWGTMIIPLDPDPLAWPNAAGPWPVRVQGSMGLTDPSDVIWASDDEFPPIFNIGELVPGSSLRGHVEPTTVQVISTTSPRETFFELTFAIKFDPGQFQCTVPGAGGG